MEKVFFAINKSIIAAHLWGAEAERRLLLDFVVSGIRQRTFLHLAEEEEELRHCDVFLGNLF